MPDTDEKVEEVATTDQTLGSTDIQPQNQDGFIAPSKEPIYLPPIGRQIRGQMYRVMAGFMDVTERAYDRLERALVNKVDAFVGPYDPEIDGERKGVRARVAKIIAALRRSRINEGLPLRHLPRLIPGNEDEDYQMMTDINDFIASRMAGYISFKDEMAAIVSYAFEKGVPPETLKDYFQDEKILNWLITNLLNFDESTFRGSNLHGLIKSLWRAASKRLKTGAQRMFKKPVDDETEQKLIKNIAFFGTTYDPTNRKGTISGFVKDLQSEYKEYDVLTWLKKNKNLLVKIFAGKTEVAVAAGLDESTQFKHIANAVQEAYEACAIEEPERFIKLSIGQFFVPYSPGEEGSTSFEDRLFRTEGVEYQQSMVVDMGAIAEFFSDILGTISNQAQISMVKIRGDLADACVAIAKEKYPDVKTCIVRNVSGRGAHHQLIHFDSPEELGKNLHGLVHKSCEILGSHIDVTDLLEDPDSTPPEIQKCYRRWYSGSTFKQTVYNRYLRRLFGHKIFDETAKSGDEEGEPLVAKKESDAELNERINRIFDNVNKYLASVAKDLGIPSIQHPEIAEINDYAELVKIACTSDDRKKRFAARRKIELASLTYSCIGAPHSVYQDHEASAIKAVLESSFDGIKLRGEGTKFVEFIDIPAKEGERYGNIRMLDPSKVVHPLKPGESKKKIRLIPAKFGGRQCYLLPTQVEDAEVDDPNEYIGKKSLKSMLTNLLSGEKKRASDLTDLVRMTFVVDSYESLKEIQGQLANNHISFGRVIKTENRYGNIVRVSSLNVSKNRSKASDYRALRYVVEVPIQDEAGNRTYLAPVEIRIMMLEDLCKEKSDHHRASHKKYEKRRLHKTLEKTTPREIFSEHYKETKPNPDDIYQETEIVPKESEDYAMAA